MMSDPISFNLIVIIFILAGFIKGIVGLGLPTVILALGSVFANLPVAMALLIIPSLTTNIWQAIVGKHFKNFLVGFGFFGHGRVDGAIHGFLRG